MFLLLSPWTGREKIAILLGTVVLPWIILLPILEALSSSRVSLEMALAGSGFLALLFTALVFGGLSFVGLWVEVGNRAYLIRKIMTSSLLFGAAATFVAFLFPLNLFLLLTLQGGFVYRRLPVWRQDFPEDTVRLEPIFFITVGIKVLVLATLLLASGVIGLP